MTITTYTALRIVEIEKDGNKDSELIILYDETEQNYYCYGTRRPFKSTKENLNYEYVYDYSRLKSLVSLILILTSNLDGKCKDKDVYTYEMHNIRICDCEIDNLDYHYLFSKFSKNNEMVAYDRQKLDKKKIRKILKTLTSSY